MKNTLSSTIQLLYGAEGIKTAYELSLTAHTLDIVCLSDKYSAIVGDYFDKIYAPRLYNGTIITRELLPDSVENRAYAKTKKDENQVRFLQTNVSQSDMLLFDTTAILISFNPSSPFAVVITDPELTKSLKVQFEALWKSL